VYPRRHVNPKTGNITSARQARKHDLFQFMASVRTSMGETYSRITARSVQDPGTAGDQAEESWASVLRDWLPSNYHVVTKGRILAPNGDTSPQVDVLVLVPSYPRSLLTQKFYFAGGVVAAFECKLTMRDSDWEKVFATAARIKRLLEPTLGTPFDELHQPPFFGLLTHTLKQRKTAKNGETLIGDALDHIRKHEVSFAQSPREMLDLVCVADQGIYVLNKSVHIHPYMDTSARQMLREARTREAVTTIYIARSENSGWTRRGWDTAGEIFGGLIHALTRYIAYRDPSIRAFSDYLSLSGTWGGIGVPVTWKLSVLSRGVITRLRRHGYEESPWSPWAEYWDTL
jgi:hypothetical protein